MYNNFLYFLCSGCSNITSNNKKLRKQRKSNEFYSEFDEY